MNVKRFFLFLLPILLLIAGFLDAFSYLQHSNMLSLETNPIVNITGSITVFIIIKIIINLAVISIFVLCWKQNEVTMFKKFTITYLLILFIVFQFFGAYTNMSVKEQIKEDLGANTIEEVPKEVVETEYTPSKEVKIRHYLDFAFIAMILPILISFASFKVWELMYFASLR